MSVLLNHLRRLSLLWLLIATAMLFGGTALAQNTPKKGSLQWYKEGPKKDWSESDYRAYYDWREKVHGLQKQADKDNQILRRQKAIINGNKITTEIWNYGSISRPGNRVTDIVWEGLGYGYEFAPFIVAEVPVTPRSHRDAYIKTDENGNPVIDANGDTVWAAIVISDGLISNGGETSPDSREFWGWEPLAYSDDGVVPYGDPDSDQIPTSNDIDRDGDGKPDSWPEGWYNPNLKRYVWPGALRQGASNADLEAFFVVDDRNNKEFEYYPFINDSTRRGLGIQIECRYYQWANPLAEDIIFLIYRVTNKSDKDLENVYFGMWGDPHIGGPSDWPDDLSFFEKDSLNMVYAWDENGKSVDNPAIIPGYFGYKFLESPGNPFDGIDNDNDGMIDESQENGIDDDGDWDPEKDDVGVDGIPNTGDYGENDGMPTAGDLFDIRKPGEPNFEWTDLDESDQIGLTSFASPPFGGQNVIRNDDFIFRNYLTPGKFDTANSSVAGDNIFLYGSGPITLKKGESRRFSIALLVGQDFDDLTLNAITAQEIYEINYQFAKPPEKPNVTAVPGDRKVTLYWDNVAESSYDPVSEENDFEGYVIYRSTDPNFADQQLITDANGTRFLFEPLKTVNGAPARFDLINEYSGLSKTIYPGRGTAYNLGSNTGLRHSFVDSNNVINGQTYYYAVVSYDHGSDELGIPPTESSKTITVNPETNEVILDVNTAAVIPRVPAAGFVQGQVRDNAVVHEAGVATGSLRIDVIDPSRLEEDNRFEITFKENPTRYTVEDVSPVTVEIPARVGQFVGLPHKPINAETFTLSSKSSGQVFEAGTDYVLAASDGQVEILSGGAIVDGERLLATYQYYPVFESELVNNEEGNPIFDGMTIYVQDQELDLDVEGTTWATGSQSNWEIQVKPFNNLSRNRYPADYEIRFSNSLVDSSSRKNFGYIKTNFQVFDVTPGRVPQRVPIYVLERSATRDSLWSPGERVIILTNDERPKFTWEFTFNEPGDGTSIAPGEGDVHYIKTIRPFSAEDKYSFVTTASKIETALASSQLDKISVVPNPYVVTNVIEPIDRQNPFDRGARRLYFNHLPKKCTIRIYTVSGELVDTIEHDSTIDDGKAFWNLTTKDNFPIAYGVYIYHVDAGALGEKVGRFAVIK